MFTWNDPLLYGLYVGVPAVCFRDTWSPRIKASYDRAADSPSEWSSVMPTSTHVLTKSWLWDIKVRCKLTTPQLSPPPGILSCTGITGSQPGWLVGKFETCLEVADMHKELGCRTNEDAWWPGGGFSQVKAPSEHHGCFLSGNWITYSNSLTEALRVQSDYCGCFLLHGKLCIRLYENSCVNQVAFIS